MVNLGMELIITDVRLSRLQVDQQAGVGVVIGRAFDDMVDWYDNWRAQRVVDAPLQQVGLVVGGGAVADQQDLLGERFHDLPDYSIPAGGSQPENARRSGCLRAQARMAFSLSRSSASASAPSPAGRRTAARSQLEARRARWARVFRCRPMSRSSLMIRKTT